VIAGVILAAGGGERFGGPKQLARLYGRPLLEHALRNARTLPRRVVVLGSHVDQVRVQVNFYGAEPVVCTNWRDGQSASLRAGVAALGDDVEAAVVLLGDQPFMNHDVIYRMLRRRDPKRFQAIRAVYNGEPGHPVVLERALLDRVGSLSGDTGARELLDGADVLEVECQGVANPVDIDTPDVLEALMR